MALASVKWHDIYEYDDDGDGQREDYDEVYDESPIALVYRGDL